VPDSCSWGGGSAATTAAPTAAAAGDDDEGPGCRESCSCGDGCGGAAGCKDVEGPASSVLRRFRRGDDEVPEGPSPSCSQEEPVSLPALLLVLGSGWTS
jgi:hypothetical protein